MPVTILLANQRSGTNVLRQVLGSHPDVVSYPEVFNYVSGDAESSPTEDFWQFFLRRIEEDRSLALPVNRAKLIEDYFQMIEDAHPDKVVIVDVKYNSLYHGQGLWTDPQGRPAMLTHFFRKKYKTLHLVRQNALRSTISEFKAHVTRVFVAKEGDEVSNAAIPVDPEAVEKRVRALLARTAVIEGWLDTYKQVRTLKYEDLWESDGSGAMRGDILGNVARFLSLDAGGFNPQPSMKKVTSNCLEDVVENYDELRDHLTAVDLAWTLED